MPGLFLQPGIIIYHILSKSNRYLGTGIKQRLRGQSTGRVAEDKALSILQSPAFSWSFTNRILWHAGHVMSLSPRTSSLKSCGGMCIWHPLHTPLKHSTTARPFLLRLILSYFESSDASTVLRRLLSLPLYSESMASSSFIWDVSFFFFSLVFTNLFTIAVLRKS